MLGKSFYKFCGLKKKDVEESLIVLVQLGRHLGGQTHRSAPTDLELEINKGLDCGGLYLVQA